MDKELLKRWFEKGYGSSEMANFLLLAEMHKEIHPDDYRTVWDAETIADRWAYLHGEVIQALYGINK